MSTPKPFTLRVSDDDMGICVRARPHGSCWVGRLATVSSYSSVSRRRSLFRSPRCFRILAAGSRSDVKFIEA
jgi:hypothetical protein